jgi:hypothetical protein
MANYVPSLTSLQITMVERKRGSKQMDGTVGPEKISSDILTKLGSLTEANRESHLLHPDADCGSGYSQTHSAGSSPYGELYSQTTPYAYHSFGQFQDYQYHPETTSVPSSNGVQRELAAQLADMQGGSLRHRTAAAQDLADVVSQVNQVGLAPDLKLQNIDDSSHLHIVNSQGGEGHSAITIDLSSGTISDESGRQYVATQNRGLVDFVPKAPVELKLPQKSEAAYDGADNLTRLTLPDKTVLTRQADGQSYAITGPNGDSIGTASKLAVNNDTISYSYASQKDGSTNFVVVKGDQMLSINEFGKIFAKPANADTVPIPVVNKQLYGAAYRELLAVANSRGLKLAPPDLGIPPSLKPTVL